MKKSDKEFANEILAEKWRCYKPEGSIGFWYVETLNGYCVCTTYTTDGMTAKRIVKDHNGILKLKKL